jgi:hypothetical protein
MTQLTTDQMESLREWVEAGLTIAEVQERLRTVLGLPLTYMETRLILDDHQLIPRSETGSKSFSPEESPAGSLAQDFPTGKVSVTVDAITRPGAIVNGSVTFGDGQRASWQLDSLGRLALNPGKPGYRPSPKDLEAFQEEIQACLRNR